MTDPEWHSGVYSRVSHNHRTESSHVYTWKPAALTCDCGAEEHSDHVAVCCSVCLSCWGAQPPGVLCNWSISHHPQPETASPAAAAVWSLLSELPGWWSPQRAPAPQQPILPQANGSPLQCYCSLFEMKQLHTKLSGLTEPSGVTLQWLQGLFIKPVFFWEFYRTLQKVFLTWKNLNEELWKWFQRLL